MELRVERDKFKDTVVNTRSTAERLRLDRPAAPTGDRQHRRAVHLTGFGVLNDGTTFGIKVLDLSYDGCKIETALALIAGVKFRLSVVGLGGALEVAVRWCKDGKAGLRFDPEETLEPVQTPRKDTRLDVLAELSLRRAGRQHYSVRMFDLTASGCKIEFVERPKTGELVWVKFDGLEAVEATVRWVDGFYGGLEFVRPIYPAVFAILLTRLKH